MGKKAILAATALGVALASIIGGYWYINERSGVSGVVKVETIENPPTNTTVLDHDSPKVRDIAILQRSLNEANRSPDGRANVSIDTKSQLEQLRTLNSIEQGPNQSSVHLSKHNNTYRVEVFVY